MSGLESRCPRVLIRVGRADCRQLIGGQRLAEEIALAEVAGERFEVVNLLRRLCLPIFNHSHV